MNDQSDLTNLVPSSNYSSQITQFEDGLLRFIDQYGLPTTQVLVQVSERLKVFSNVEGVVDKIDAEQKQRSIYISKFIAASAAGLFDAALNYMWDETIYELRRRVARYDLAYFYDAAVGSSSEKRKRLNTEEDLVRIDDSELIQGSHEIGLISDLGFKHLDYVRYMRNWASAAHPNQNQITGLQLIGMLETCVIEVITLPLSNVVVGIKKLLANIKTNRIDETEAKQISSFFADLPREKVHTLAEGFFGIYTQADTTSQTRQNVRLLVPDLWGRLDEHTKQQVGVKYARFLANNEQDKQKLAREFLEAVSGLSYIPDGIRAAEIQTAIENLLSSHRGVNNFYSEPPFARQLQRLVGETGKVPLEINNEYVLCLVEVFLTNGNGVAWNAESIYTLMFDQFNPDQALIAILSFSDLNISSRLQHSLCQQKFRSLMEMMKNKVSMPAVKELIEAIEKYKGPLDKMKDDSEIKRKVTALRKIIAA
ncbi:hypothetical protein IQ268_11945 [Oculatella sp. LEGE 06141]|uniref:hypothetical protein n=1 Tax=Oculatella sp. LEGE 06141 TaxID=1828648 RepID=UPI00188258EE|nr:hypothetical protein [Oculatella sp. LEGE 06141]MBE9179274.1 hypothetical protein [Oculatella sp. LEGE 06141]